jgi:hypothetical protein
MYYVIKGEKKKDSFFFPFVQRLPGKRVMEERE